MHSSRMLIAVLLLALFSSKTPAVVHRPLLIKHYSLTVQIDTLRKSISGIETVEFRTFTGADTLVLQRDSLKIDSVFLHHSALHFEMIGAELHIPMPGSKLGSSQITIYYHGIPRKGLHISPGEIYTGFFTSSWMPCDDRPGSKATFDLILTEPKEFKVVASGELIENHAVGDSSISYHWRQLIPVSAYVFGFAAGPFNEFDTSIGKVNFRYLTKGFDAPKVRKIFSATDSIMRFFETLSGKAYPYSTYTQVLTNDENEQEVAGFCLLSTEYGNEILKDPRENWLIIHELAHQWWGNSVTCQTWSDFWLNEGMVTFLTAAYKEHVYGLDEYDREMELARLRYHRVIGTAKDRSIVYSHWTKPEEMSGVITYYKGALVLNYLRYVIGEKAFWRWLKSYTQIHWLKSVTTADFERAMEHAYGKSLEWFFREWVYSAQSPKLSAKYSELANSCTITFTQQIDSAFSIPLDIAIESGNKRRVYPVLLGMKRQSFTFPIRGAIKAVRLDDGGRLPIEIAFDRPTTMLLYQATHEPDLFGRIDAMDELVAPERKLAQSDSASVKQMLVQESNSDSSRLVRQVAEKLLAKFK